MFSFFMASACKDDEKPVESDVVMLGFDKWDDIARFDMNPTYFVGNWLINREPEFIKGGTGSWKIYVDATKANQPNFVMKAAGVKTDITDVKEFTLWAYSDAEEPFDLILTAYAGDEVVASPIAIVQKGENNLSFVLEREPLMQKGKLITEYSISFSGIKGGTTLYLDELTAKITTEPIVLKKEVQDVIDSIASFGANPSKTLVYDTLAKYRALSGKDQKCVTNYNTLKSVVNAYYLDDLATAQIEDPKTWLYFGQPFGEIQVEKITAGISSYSYSTEQKCGDESGSLKVEFTISSTNWLTLSTAATSLPKGNTDPSVKFSVYNDSDQVKALCVGWNAPLHPVAQDRFYVIEPREWTEIKCPSSWLYDAGGASGGIQICGLAGVQSGGAQPPEGVMYFSSFTTFDDEKIVKAARVGEDQNTLYLFDQEIGAAQVTSSYDIDINFTTDVKFGNEAGSLELNVHDQTDPQIIWSKCGYEFNQGDYVVFYVYNDSNRDVIDISLGYTHRQRCYNGQWTMVLWKASDVDDNANTWSWLIARNYGASDFAGMSWGNLDGKLYFSKAKVYSAEQIKDLVNVADTYEYTIGNTTLVGKAETAQNGTYNENPDAFNDVSYSNPYYVNGMLRWNINPVTIQEVRQPKIGFTFKNSYEIKSGLYMEVTVKGAVEGQVTIQVFNSLGFTDDGHVGTPAGELVRTLDNGFAVYRFNVGQLAGKDKATDFSAFRLGVRDIGYPVTGQVVVSDITVVNQ